MKTPEGNLQDRWPKSAKQFPSRAAHFLSIDEDDKRAAARGVSAGFDIMIHGIQNGRGWIGAFHRWNDWTAGCIAVTDEEIEELWRVTPDGTTIEIRP
jgi:murein L,D-transpeptidase YafK